MIPILSVAPDIDRGASDEKDTVAGLEPAGKGRGK